MLSGIWIKTFRFRHSSTGSMLPVQYLVTPKVIETISLQKNVHDFFTKQNPYRRYVVNAILIKDIL